MGGDHHHHQPAVPEPPYAKLLANKSALCPPDFHYNRGECPPDAPDDAALMLSGER